ncbi:MAG: sulfatase [Chloroflexi bacterium]|nr:MAG: sulfatase [Chloroflexota bacterium]
MKHATGRDSLAKHVALGAVVWGASSLVYGLVEALTNTGAGLYQPIRIWAVMWGVYAVGGLLGGAAIGLLVFVWHRMRQPARTALGSFLVAAFCGSLLFLFLAVPINDRYLPLLLSPRSLAVNGVLFAACAGVVMRLHRHLRARTGMGLVLSALNLAFFFSVCLALGQYVDTFVATTWAASRSVPFYAGLITVCAVGYMVADRVGRLVASAALAPAAVAVLALLAVGVALKMRGADAPAAGVPAGGAKPNVLWIVMDTTRADHLSAYGYQRPTTPNLDAIAAEGTLFENAIAQAPWTVPSHFQMVTSRYTAGRQSILDSDFVTAAEMLKANGYETGAVLANFLLGRRSGFEQGFDKVVDGPVTIFCLSVLEKIPVIKALLRLNIFPSNAVIGLLDRKEFLEGAGARADAVNEQAARWIERQGSQPFFLFINYMDPHDPYDPPQPFRDRFAGGVDPVLGFVRYSPRLGRSISSGQFVRDVLPKLSPQDLAKIVALYDAEIAYLDDRIGRLVSVLKARGLYDHTILVVTADHGELFGEHGLANHMKSLSEEEIHVPLIMRYPSAIPPGRRVATPVELSCILPTLLELLGIPPQTALDGRSLLPLVQEAAAGQDGFGDTFSFLIRRPDRSYPHTAPGHLIGLRTAAFKYVWSSTGRNAYYDLLKDPHAEHNLYGDGVDIASAEQRLADWRKKAGFENIDADERLDRLTTERLRALGYVQ